MEDKIDIMVKIISKAGNFHRIKHDLKKILTKLRVFSEKPVINFKIFHRWKTNCFISCVVKAENNVFGRDLNIMIKPDHSSHRVLREVVQEDGEIREKAEDRDDPGLSDREVFENELIQLEKDIAEAIKDIKTRELEKVA